MKNFLIILVIIVLLAVGSYYFFFQDVATPDGNGSAVINSGQEQDPQAENQMYHTDTVVGASVEGRDITAYHYGTGDTEILFVGGVHGGYSWNTTLAAYELMDYLEVNEVSVPGNVRVTVVPALNPDGIFEVTGKEGRFSKADVGEDTIPGRFNANNVDLNRNFDCDWQEEAKWQGRDVSGGTNAFSEPESRAIRDYIRQNDPTAVVVWYSAAGGVFASNCHNGILAETRELTNLYADASGYDAFEEFDFYSITGDMVNWLAKENIPAISVLLSTHEVIEWDKNKKGVDALLEYYREEPVKATDTTEEDTSADE